MSKLTIPQVRDRLRILAHLVEMGGFSPISVAREMRELADSTYRINKKIRAPVSAKPITAEVKRKVLAVYRANPRAQIKDIAERFGLNSGRVSEIIGGKR